MTIGGFTVSEIVQLSTLASVVFIIARGIVTKKDCDKCKADTDKDLDKGDVKFEEIGRTLTDHGEQLSGISSTVNGMAGNVKTLVDHHLKGGG